MYDWIRKILGPPADEAPDSAHSVSLIRAQAVGVEDESVTRPGIEDLEFDLADPAQVDTVNWIIKLEDKVGQEWQVFRATRVKKRNMKFVFHFPLSRYDHFPLASEVWEDVGDI